MPSVAVRRPVIEAKPVAPVVAVPVAEVPAVAEPTPETATPQITLRRSGVKPYQFWGSVVLESTGYSSTCALWHEINIYRHEADGYVVNIRTFSKSSGARDSFFVKRVDTMDDVLETLENHDAAADVKISFDAAESRSTTAATMLKAVALRAAIEEAVRDFQALSGEVMYQLSFLPEESHA
jgi:hypothetical protein